MPPQPTPTQIKAVFFDCDGLLVDSETLGMNVAAQVCAEFAITISVAELQTFIGITDEKWYRELVARKGLSLDHQQLLRRHFELYERELPNVKPFPGAIELPRELTQANIPIALVSGSTRAQIDIVLQSLGLTGMFKVIVSFEDIGDHSKPDPYGYELALERLNEMRRTATSAPLVGQPSMSVALPASLDSQIQPSEVLVLEDATSGIKAAMAAGMKVIGVKNTGVQDISEATSCVDTLEELLGVGMKNWKIRN